jgi:hypothetical protein
VQFCKLQFYKNSHIIAILPKKLIPLYREFLQFIKTAKLWQFSKLEFIKTAKLLQFCKLLKSPLQRIFAYSQKSQIIAILQIAIYKKRPNYCNLQIAIDINGRINAIWYIIKIPLYKDFVAIPKNGQQIFNL